LDFISNVIKTKYAELMRDGVGMNFIRMGGRCRDVDRMMGINAYPVKRRRQRYSEAGISPVVATVIIVAIAIVLSLALAFWASGLVTGFQQAERADARLIFATATMINISVGNTGSNDITITQILALVGGQDENPSIKQGDCTTDLSLSVTIPPGGRIGICLTKSTFKRGSTVEVVVITSTGNSYRTFAFIP